MDRPILVIHGVANPTYDDFDKSVVQLAKGLPAEWTLIRGYWGDLGAPTDTIAYAVPEFQETWFAHRDGSITPPIHLPWEAALNVQPSREERRDPGPRQKVGRALLNFDRTATTSRLEVTASDNSVDAVDLVDAVDVVSAAARQRLTELGHRRSLAAVRDAIRPAFDDHALTARAASRKSLKELGRTIAERYVINPLPPTAEGAQALLGPIDALRSIAERTIRAVDDVASGVVDIAGGAFMQFGREIGLKKFGGGIGDALVYQAHQRRIQTRIRQCVKSEGAGWGLTPDRPIPVVAHSLGGIIAWDMAVGFSGQLYIDPLITFGSQSSVIEIFSPRKRWASEGDFRPPAKLELPPTIHRWFNFWDPLDFLAFSASRVFKTAGTDEVKDIHVPWDDVHKDLFSHDDYWRDPVFQAVVRNILENLEPLTPGA
jgi:hypothetical protein